MKQQHTRAHIYLLRRLLQANTSYMSGHNDINCSALGQAMHKKQKSKHAWSPPSTSPSSLEYPCAQPSYILINQNGTCFSAHVRQTEIPCFIVIILIWRCLLKLLSPDKHKKNRHQSLLYINGAAVWKEWSPHFFWGTNVLWKAFSKKWDDHKHQPAVITNDAEYKTFASTHMALKRFITCSSESRMGQQNMKLNSG